MRKLIFWRMAITLSIFMNACGGATKSPKPSSDMSTPTDGPHNNSNVILTQVFSATPARTQIEFLIDNSNSVEDVSKGGCEKKFGEGRFDFVRFITGIFRDSVNFPQDLYLGAGTFGNEYKSLVPLTSISNLGPIPTPDIPVNNTRYTVGIRGALNEMYQDQSAQTRYLVILTDGETETESIGAVQTEIKNYQDPNLHIYIVLLCPRHYQIWADNVNHLDIARVINGLDNFAYQIFQDLKYFLQANGTFLSPQSNQNQIFIPGYSTSIRFSFWNADTGQGNYLGLRHDSQGFSHSLNVFDTFTYRTNPSFGCQEHLFTIDPPPSGTWFLYIQPKSFPTLTLLLDSNGNTPLEVVNNKSLIIDFQLNNMALPDYDLRNWKDCFLVDMVKLDGNLLFDHVTPIAYDGVIFLRADEVMKVLHGQLQWDPPPYNAPRLAKITFRLRSINSEGLTWEGIYYLPIKYEAVFLPMTLNPGNTASASVTNIAFNNVALQPRVFLVSEKNHIELSNISSGGDSPGDFQKTTHTVNGKEASEVKFTDQCSLSEDIPNQTYACIGYQTSLPLAFIYNFQTFRHIIESYRFNRLFFIWEETNVSKAKAWECKIDTFIAECKDIILLPVIISK